MRIIVYAAGACAVVGLAANLWDALLSLYRAFDGATLATALGLAAAIAVVVVATRRAAALSAGAWQAAGHATVRFLAAHRVGLIAATLTSAAGLLTMGAPGVLLFAAFDAAVQAGIAGPLGWPTPHGDTMWPMAIGYALLAPWLIFGATLLLARWTMLRRWPAAGLAGGAALAVLLALHLVYRAVN